MKLLLDANLPPQSAKRLQDLYPDSLHLRSPTMSSASDTEIWAFAQREGFVIMSKDSDFYKGRELNKSAFLECEIYFAIVLRTALLLDAE
jgi:predicted nuclease of predicted toxin-antitoxin system